MALRVNCTMCGASIPADDQAIRHGLVACDYCSTILRITEKGTEEYKGLLARREAPSGVTVERKGPGELTITARRTKKAAASFDKSGVLRGAKIGLAIAAIISALFIPIPVLGIAAAIAVFPFAAVAAVAVSVIAVGVLERKLPPLRMKSGTIYPSLGWGGPGPLQADSIKQLYSVVARVRTAPGYPPFANCNVCALTEDGRRVILMSGLDSEEVALYIEEILEVEAGIFNLPVYGDVDVPRGKGEQIAGLPDEAPIEDLLCESCGEALSVTSEAYRRGFVVCEHCSGLVLLYAPGSTKPILGKPPADSPTIRYRVEERPGGLAILASDTGAEVIQVDRGKLSLAGSAGMSRPLSFAEGTTIRVRQASAPPAGAEVVGSIARSTGGFIRRMKDAMTYSGDVDPLSLMLQSGALPAFEVVAREADGRETCLLEDIRDPREALVLAEALKEALSL